jgi:hypothetical protein
MKFAPVLMFAKAMAIPPAFCKCVAKPITRKMPAGRAPLALWALAVRTEHMFFTGRLPKVQRMILAKTSEERTKAL